MTNVIIHGILARKFGKLIKIRLGNIKSVVSVIDSMKRGFRKELCELFHEKVYYEIVINKDALNEVHLMPCIVGFGGGKGGGFKILGYVLQVIAVVMAIVSLGASTNLSAFLWFVGSLMIATLGSLSTAHGMKLDAMAKIQAFYAQLADQTRTSSGKKDAYAGGGTKLTGGAGSSYLFSNEVNFNTQGQIVRLGYGKVKTGTNTISVSIKNFPTSVALGDDAASSISNNVIRLYD